MSKWLKSPLFWVIAIVIVFGLIKIILTMTVVGNLL